MSRSFACRPSRRWLVAAAYHCQQTAEKVLKGFLVLAGAQVRKTHDLSALAELVETQFASAGMMLVPVPGWTIWGVAHRYPAKAGLEPEPPVEEINVALLVVAEPEAAWRSRAHCLRQRRAGAVSATQGRRVDLTRLDGQAAQAWQYYLRQHQLRARLQRTL